MSVMPPGRRMASARLLGGRLRGQGGFTMILAMLVLLVTTLLSMAIFVAVESDASLTRSDLNGKRAYAAAQAGLQQYLYELNANSTSSTWWETCANDMSNGTGAAVAEPGASYGETYSYTPVPANGATSCSNTNPTGTLIDSTTGTLRMKVTGSVGTSSKTIIASLRTLSPLSYLWYTVHETLDPGVTGDSGCSTFYWQGSGPPADCQIQYTNGDHINGPLYTQDQLNIAAGTSPTFGRSGSTDQVVSAQAASASVCAFSQCQGAGINQPVVNPSQPVPLPGDNSRLALDAGAHGEVFHGTTTLTINGTTASGWNCPTSSTCAAIAPFSLTQYPIVYATNATGATCSGSYNPAGVTYPTSSGNSNSTLNGHYYGPCGDIYVAGSYSTPLTIAAANDVILTGSLTNSTDTNGTTSPTGSATLGIVANLYVRVMHTCGNGNPSVTIDGAILTLVHSFFVDNVACTVGSPGTLTVHGAIAQYYRGEVGGNSSNLSYLKNYNYDDRLGLILPPYLFDLQNTQWTVFRETLCDQTGSATSAGSCSNPSS